MGKIHLLDEKTASQIAAGEVVERPANVVKELLENAIDAGASRIQIDIEAGGLERIRITDDGFGMSADDAVLCFSPHSTSKLKSIDDLERIATFGFRGEALASIASVSKTALRTREASAANASETRVEGGRIVHVGDVGAPTGTEIDVCDLFYNVPARRKFLKTQRTEQNHIERVVRAQALANPFVAFRLRVDGRVLFDMHAAKTGAKLSDPTRRERAIACLGENVRGHLFEVEEHTELVHVRGYGISPHATRRDFAGVHVQVNGRPVRDRGLVQAVCTAYRPVLEIGRKPIATLAIDVEPETLDVNVHPQKEEVRFSDSRRVHTHLIRVLHDTLSKTPWLERQVARTYALRKSGALKDAPLATDHQARVRDAFERFKSKRQDVHKNTRRDVPKIQPRAPSPSSGPHEHIEIMGFFGERFLFVNENDSILVIDSERAFETLFRERILNAGSQKVPRAPLLFPKTLAKSAPLDRESLDAHGFEIDEDTSADECILRTLPKFVSVAAASEVCAAFMKKSDEKVLLRTLKNARRVPQSTNEWLAFYSELKATKGSYGIRRLDVDELSSWFERA